MRNRPFAGAGRPWRRYLVPVAGVGLCAVAVALVLSTVSTTPVQPAKPVIVLSGSWAPYVDPDLPGGGPVNILLGDVLERIGYAPTTSFTSWSRAEEKVRQQEALGAFPFVGSARRQDTFEVSAPIMDFQYVMFAGRTAAGADIRDAADLRAYKIGFIKGYDYWPELHRAVDEFTEFDTSLEAFEALAAGTIDLLPEGLAPGRAVLRSPGFLGDAGAITQLDAKGNDLLASTQSLHFIMPRRKGSAALMARFDAALSRLQGQDEFRSIVASLDGEQVDDAVLRPARPGQLIDLVDPSSDTTLVTPSGTSVRVTAWPDEYSVGFTGKAPDDLRVEVKLLTGPLQGRVLLARAVDVQLEETGP